MSNRPPEETPKRLLIVHDDEQILSTLIAIFQNTYSVVFCSNPKDASPLIRQGFRPHVIIAPSRYSTLKGDTFVVEARSYIPEVVCIFTVDSKEMAAMATQPLPPGTFMLLSMAWQTPEIMQAVRLAFQHYRITLENAKLLETKSREGTVLDKVRKETGLSHVRIAQETDELAQNHIQIVTLLGQVFGGLRQVHHTNHALYTAFIAQQLALSMSLPKADVTQIMIAALLHDVGKMNLPHRVVDADPDTLAEADRAIYETHVNEGAKILSRTGLPRKVVDIVRQHHERLNGGGFPGGFLGNQVMVEGQILAVADFYHNGVYRMRDRGPVLDGPVPAQTTEERNNRIDATLAELRRREDQYPSVVLHNLFAIVDKIHESDYENFTNTLISTDWKGLFPEVAAAYTQGRAKLGKPVAA